MGGLPRRPVLVPVAPPPRETAAPPADPRSPPDPHRRRHGALGLHASAGRGTVPPDGSTRTGRPAALGPRGTHGTGAEPHRAPLVPRRRAARGPVGTGRAATHGVGDGCGHAGIRPPFAEGGRHRCGATPGAV